VLGYSRKEVLSEPFLNFVHPDDREATLGEYASVLSGGESLEFENRWRCHDGSYRWLQWATATDRDADLIYAVARDVTEAKQTAAKVQTLLAEQAALRRVATLVAREGEGERVEVFAVVAEEVGRLLAADAAGVVRYEPDGQGVIVGAWSRAGEPPLPSDSVIRFDAGTAVGPGLQDGATWTQRPFRWARGIRSSQAQAAGVSIEPRYTDPRRGPRLGSHWRRCRRRRAAARGIESAPCRLCQANRASARERRRARTARRLARAPCAGKRRRAATSRAQPP
jgi:PAS fold